MRLTSFTATFTASFSITAAGDGILKYQSQRNELDIPGATSSSYELTSVEASDNDALFSCVVSNSAGSVKSTTAKLTVKRTITNEYLPMEKGNYWIYKLYYSQNASSGTSYIRFEIMEEVKQYQDVLYIFNFYQNNTSPGPEWGNPIHHDTLHVSTNGMDKGTIYNNSDIIVPMNAASVPENQMQGLILWRTSAMPFTDNYSIAQNTTGLTITYSGTAYEESTVAKLIKIQKDNVDDYYEKGLGLRRAVLDQESTLKTWSYTLDDWIVQSATRNNRVDLIEAFVGGGVKR